MFLYESQVAFFLWEIEYFVKIDASLLLEPFKIVCRFVESKNIVLKYFVLKIAAKKASNIIVKCS